MLKKILTLIAALILCCGLLTAAAETTLPLTADTVDLTFMGMNMNSTRVGRYDETDMMKYLEEKTNVHIIWNMIPQASWSEKKNLTIAGGELPDGFMGPLSLTADEAQLQTLSGIGQTRAQAIISYRQTHGAFQSIEDIQNVNGIKSGVYDKIKDDISVG